MTANLVCWKCGASLQQLPLPLGRSAECRGCGAELHVCRMCEFYEPRLSNGCREPMAEEVMDKQRANFCDYFQPRPEAFVARNDAAAKAARAQIETLFRGEAAGSAGDAARSTAADARQALERLFGSASKKGDR